MPHDERSVDERLAEWRQGDLTLDAGVTFLHLADLLRPLLPESRQQADEAREAGDPLGLEPVLAEVAGLVVLTQTCDIARAKGGRPFIEVAPLVKVPESSLSEIEKGMRPAYAYLSTVAGRNLAVDLDRTMTVERSVVAGWNREDGCPTDRERVEFAAALARKRARFAFPDDFVEAIRPLRERIVGKHSKQSPEGEILRALREIRVRAAPSWNASCHIEVTVFFIKEIDPPHLTGRSHADCAAVWEEQVSNWMDRIRESGRFDRIEFVVGFPEDLRASDVFDSQPLDLDHLSGY